MAKATEKPAPKVYRGPHIDDQRLRDKGFVIRSRPAKGEAIWTGLDGELWSHSEALQWVNMAGD
jgi:hypothetical protein